MKSVTCVWMLAAISFAAPAQSTDPPQGTPAIADNSFLVEEAYNQEAGVVQHIQSFLWAWQIGTWVYSFTQEWPLGGVRHLSLEHPFLGSSTVGPRTNARQCPSRGRVSTSLRTVLVVVG